MIAIGVKSLTEFISFLGRKAFVFAGIQKQRQNYSGDDGESIGDYVLRWYRATLANDISMNFSQGVAPDGSQWPQLKWRQGQILVYTGWLLRSAHDAAFRNTQWNGDQIDSEMNDDPPYWHYHQYGTRIIPKRTFFGPRIDTIKELAQKYIEVLRSKIMGK